MKAILIITKFKELHKCHNIFRLQPCHCWLLYQAIKRLAIWPQKNCRWRAVILERLDQLWWTTSSLWYFVIGRNSWELSTTESHRAHLLCCVRLCRYKSTPSHQDENVPRMKSSLIRGEAGVGKKWNISSDMFIIQIYLHISILKGVTGIISQHVDHLLFIIINVNISLMKPPLQYIPPWSYSHLDYISLHTSASTKLAAPHPKHFHP